jgi:hypothetical protein
MSNETLSLKVETVERDILAEGGDCHKKHTGRRRRLSQDPHEQKEENVTRYTLAEGGDCHKIHTSRRSRLPQETHWPKEETLTHISRRIPFHGHNNTHQQKKTVKREVPLCKQKFKSSRQPGCLLG